MSFRAVDPFNGECTGRSLVKDTGGHADISLLKGGHGWGSPYGRRTVAVRFGEPLARVCLSVADVAEAGTSAPEGLDDDVASFGPRPVVNSYGFEFVVVPLTAGDGVDA